MLTIIAQVIFIYSLSNNKFQTQAYIKNETPKYSLSSSLFPKDIKFEIASFETTNSELASNDSSINNSDLETNENIAQSTKSTHKTTNPSVNLIKKDSTKPSPTPTASPTLKPTPKPNHTETKTTTLVERDVERIMISELIVDTISQYYLKYGDFPKIYKDKSQTELADEPSYVMYFYDNDENKTNSLAFTLGDNKGDYSYSRVSKCEDIEIKENMLVFIYQGADFVLCKEDGETEHFWVIN